MHSTQTPSAVFHHNGDYSGEVHIICRATNQEIHINFDDIKNLVAEYIRRQRISKLEQANDEAVLMHTPYAFL